MRSNLNCEAGKFSKIKGVGVFSNDAHDTNIPVEVWRYYLLTNRPKVSDILFTWTDLQAKLNTELLNNLGNFINRVLSFISKDPGSFLALLSYLFYLKVIQEVVEVQDKIPSFWMLHLLSNTLGDKIGAYVEQYVETQL
ncbi:unnamed protein product [Lactuca saligna]|uniref:Methionyl/Leucyl tRNA synthetase domain-containing protein n=1 Tax=Lactuca saligna TaxID=75948 RepID=A0AA35YYJ8_LACSI|nr:unnamed protein product [Lactuca saligna]